MKAVFDLTMPKQVRFFLPLMQELERRGVQVRPITRQLPEMQLILKGMHLRAKAFGAYGGATLAGKLRRSVERVHLLAAYFQREKPNVLVTLSNPESARAAYGLAIPIVCFNDLPESKAVSSLSLPLAAKVCAPWIVPPKAFAAYGVGNDRLFRYRALDPVIWQERHRINPAYREELGLTPARPLIVFRETESQSTYVDGDIVGTIYREVRRRHPDWQLLNIPRYQPHPFYDTGSLLAHADALVGGGGTMCVEAAYYGTPVIATRNLECRYMHWLFQHRLAKNCLEPKQALAELERTITNRNRPEGKKHRARSQHLFAQMQFPLKEIAKLIQTTARV